jgi:hypothetical protein
VQVEEAKESHYKPLTEVREEIEHNLIMGRESAPGEAMGDRLERRLLLKDFCND